MGEFTIFEDLFKCGVPQRSYHGSDLPFFEVSNQELWPLRAYTFYQVATTIDLGFGFKPLQILNTVCP